MSGQGFEINRDAVRRMAHSIESEFAKHPVTVPVVAGDPAEMTSSRPEQDELALLDGLRGVGALDMTSAVDPTDANIGLPPKRLQAAVNLARSDGYINSASYGGDVYITPQGRHRSQRAATVQGPSTMVNNDFSGATFTASNIATGDGSTQTIDSPLNMEALRQFRYDALTTIDRCAVDPDALEDLDADLELLDAQLDNPTTLKKGLRRALMNIEQFAVNSTAGAAGAGLATLIAQIF
ncbi:MAG: hypothetical protein WA988_11445 [Candidatus Nanopelagicales bacterium]